MSTSTLDIICIYDVSNGVGNEREKRKNHPTNIYKHTLCVYYVPAEIPAILIFSHFALVVQLA